MIFQWFMKSRTLNLKSDIDWWFKFWMTGQFLIFLKAFNGKHFVVSLLNMLQNFIKFQVLVTEILVKVWRNFLEFHGQFANISHSYFIVAYFSAEAYYTNFGNFAWRFQFSKNAKYFFKKVIFRWLKKVRTLDLQFGTMIETLGDSKIK